MQLIEARPTDHPFVWIGIQIAEAFI